MAYRGHDEDSESLNKGKWKEFSKLMLLTNKHFKDLHSSITATHETYDYTSKRSCNEMIQALEDEVRHAIRSEIEASKMFAMLIDECKDSAGHEELSICFRYLDTNMVIIEGFYSLTRLVETHADGILQKGAIPTLNEVGLTSKLLLHIN
ncbi:Zinc finger MYM-type protein 1-like [Oopsacas minuta]|uniref:Zinc finger MYM-type protein 1-like n=1 Tax=Oopsacas minuta TaxID=111878 RepID=A0AAV7KPA5_9METZ|nr:Zinc finger MYM-type protein 1-like [Oopsacas minuta]